MTLGGGGYENVLGFSAVGWAAAMEQYVEGGSEGVKDNAAYDAELMVLLVGPDDDEGSD